MNEPRCVASNAAGNVPGDERFELDETEWWRALLAASGVAFESRSRAGTAVVRRKKNLTRDAASARPDTHEATRALERAVEAGELEVTLKEVFDGL